MTSWRVRLSSKRKVNEMRNETLARLTLVFCLFAPYAASAGMVPLPFQRSPTGDIETLEFGVVHDLGTETGYRVDAGLYSYGEFTLKRVTTSAYIGYGDLFLAVGVIHKAEIEVETEYVYPVARGSDASYYYPPYQQQDIEGDGFIAAVGVRSTLWEKNNLSLAAFGQVTYLRESCSARSTYTWYDTPVYVEGAGEVYRPDYEEPIPRTETIDTDIDIDSTELIVGVVARYIGPRYTMYAGLEFAPYSDIEVNWTVEGTDGTNVEETHDLERADQVTFVLGWQASLKNGFLMLESRAVGEKGLRVGAGVNF